MGKLTLQIAVALYGIGALLCRGMRSFRGLSSSKLTSLLFPVKRLFAFEVLEALGRWLRRPLVGWQFGRRKGRVRKAYSFAYRDQWLVRTFDRYGACGRQRRGWILPILAALVGSHVWADEMVLMACSPKVGRQGGTAPPGSRDLGYRRLSPLRT